MIKITKPVNLRDLGGLIGAQGRPILPSRLLRAGEPCGLTAEETNTLLLDYQLRQILDLRGHDETAKDPIPPMAGVAYHSVSLMRSVEDEPSLANLHNRENPENMHAFMVALYAHLLNDAYAQNGYRQIFDLLLDLREGASLFHCYAGKDRTGVTAALVLTALGVSREEIYTDYLLTNIMRRDANAELLKHLEARGASQQHIDAMRIGLMVDKVYLDQAYAEAERLCGSMDGYLREVLEIDSVKQQHLQRLYLREG